MKKILIFLSLFITFSFALAQQASLSVSNNGKYVISVDDSGNAYLWDLKNNVSKNLGNNYNPRSAYFVPNSDNYLLQNIKTKEVTITNVNGKIIKEFTPDFMADSQAINSSLTTWVGSLPWGDAYQYNLDTGKKKQIYVSWSYAKSEHSPYWRGNPYKGGLPNGYAINNQFNFANNDVLIMTADNIMVIYNAKEHKWKLINKNVNQTMSAIDPNGEFVYTLDSSRVGRAIKYDLQNNKVITFPNTANEDNFFFNLAQRNEIPKLENNYKKPNGYTNFGFIDNNKVLITYKGLSQPYLWTGLYDINNIKIGKFYKDGKSNFAIDNPIKYFPLINNPKDYLDGNYNIEPRPNVDGYNYTFDTSVEAHKLVIGQANGNGIMVYNYNPSDETLKLDWVGEPPKAEEKKEEKSKGWFW
ncbi:hypothetical protein [Francisella sp. SYW-2]|uniref:hypothetical protein n=1 Tax=Francisella sp. SYW-2 TaxID=2610886 RepID=UPI00123E258D|nr:hypothetical protein [Francisella sp. SYW-2]